MAEDQEADGSGPDVLTQARSVLLYLQAVEVTSDEFDEFDRLVAGIRQSAGRMDLTELKRLSDRLRVLLDASVSDRSPGIETTPVDIGPALNAIEGQTFVQDTRDEDLGGAAPNEWIDLIYPDKPPREAAGDGVLRRTPHLVPDYGREPFHQGDRFSIEVYLDTQDPESPQDFFTASGVHPGETLAIDVWLTASDHFELERTVGSLSLNSTVPRSTSALFRATVASETPGDEPARISAVFCWRGAWCGRVERELAVTGGPIVPADPKASTGVVALDGTVPLADLVVHVNARKGSAGFDVVVDCPALSPPKLDGDWFPEGGASAWVEAVTAGLFAGNPSPAEKHVRLRSAGVRLFQASPKPFQEAYWGLVDQETPPRSLKVISDDPIVPWELMVPSRVGTKTRGMALGVSCAMARWLHDLPDPALAIPLNDSAVVAPTYNPVLQRQEEELNLVLGHVRGTPFRPMTFDDLEAEFADSSPSLIHFVGHGRNLGAGLQELVLGTGRFRSDLLRESALGLACAAAHPLVFLNACEVGLAVSGLTAVDGFAPEFLRSGASCVLAPLWPVEDSVGFEYASAFYAELAADATRPFADIVRELRGRAYEDGGTDTWVAYCLYGNPLASETGP